jgi:hypothetical protein
MAIETFMAKNQFKKLHIKMPRIIEVKKTLDESSVFIKCSI